MSFSSDVKNEICTFSTNARHCNLAIMSSVLYNSTTVYFENSELKIVSDNIKILELLKIILKNLYCYDAEIKINNKSNTLKINNSEVIKNIIASTGFSEFKKIDALLIKRECCKKAYLKGAFLVCGSINNPEKAYHLEFVLSDYERALEVSEVINFFRLNSKIIKRKSSYVVYLKESDQIVDLLNIIGAHVNLLEFENVRILKEVRNNINRVVNCEAENIKKVIKASNFHIDNILLIKEKKGLDFLSSDLRTVAEARLIYTDSSLKELGEKMNPKLSKSCVNHRLRKINSIAESIRGGLI